MQTELFLKKSLRVRKLFIGFALALAGAAVMTSVGGIGSMLIAAGVLVLVFGIAKDRKPLVIVDTANVRFRFTRDARIVPFTSIERVDLLRSQDLEVFIFGGASVVIPMARLDEADGTWLKKELRKQARAAKALAAS